MLKRETPTAVESVAFAVFVVATLNRPLTVALPLSAAAIAAIVVLAVLLTVTVMALPLTLTRVWPQGLKGGCRKLNGVSVGGVPPFALAVSCNVPWPAKVMTFVAAAAPALAIVVFSWAWVAAAVTLIPTVSCRGSEFAWLT